MFSETYLLIDRYLKLVLLPCALLAVVPLPAVAAEDFCARAQQWIAETPLVAEVAMPADFDAYVESKASAMPLVVQQFESRNEQGELHGMSCKMNSAEAIRNAGHGENAAGENRSCALVTRRMLEETVGRLQAQGVTLADLPVVAEDDTAYMGPMWLNPWPYSYVREGDRGEITLHAKAMFVPDAWYIPMPARFKGVFYCHLVHPVYLETLLGADSVP